MKKYIIVTPLYYILDDVKSQQLFKDLSAEDKDTTLIVYDDISPLPSVAERYYALMSTFNLPDGVFEVEDVVFHDVDKQFTESVLGTIDELGLDGSDVEVHFFPTTSKSKKRAKWADFVYDDFIIDDLAKSWESLKERMDVNFAGRFVKSWEHYMFGMKGQLDKVVSNIVYYGEFDMDNGDTYPIMLGVKDYTKPFTFSPIEKPIEPLDLIVDVVGACKDDIDALGIEVEEVLSFDSTGNPEQPYGYDVVVKLAPTEENLKILTDIRSRDIDRRISPTMDYAIHLPNNSKSYLSVWFERIIADASLGTEG